jgi:hypothetical protein
LLEEIKSLKQAKKLPKKWDWLFKPIISHTWIKDKVNKFLAYN